jgi:LacI family transcriptional regulator
MLGLAISGLAHAFKERKLGREVVFVGHEATEGTKDLLLDGTIDAVIHQNPRVEA